MLKALFRRCKQYQIVCNEQTVNPAASNSDTLVDSAVTVYLIYIDYEEDRRQRKPLLESNTAYGCDLTLPTQTQTSEQEYSDLTASNRLPLTPYFCNTPQSVSRGTRSYMFSTSTKHV